MLAEVNILEHITDYPWPGWQVQVLGMKVTLMSSAIAAIIIVTGLLLVALPPLARRAAMVPSGRYNALEVIVIFVRDMIARPALHDKAYQFLPFLLTLFVFVLGLNLLGILPLESLSVAAGLPRIGGAATSVLSVCAGLASLSLLTIAFLGLAKQAQRYHLHKGWPLWLSVPASPLLWAASLAPGVPGAVGKMLAVPLVLLELAGVVAKCFALMVRLFANMISGHTLLAVLMMFVIMALESMIRGVSSSLLIVGPACIAASVVVDVLELLVAGLQAYIFTFLTAMFIGLYVETAH